MMNAANDPEEVVARTMNDDEINQLCLTIQKCLIAASVSLKDGIEIHVRMLVSVMLTLHKNDCEKAAIDVERILGQCVKNLRDPMFMPQPKALGGILLQ